jgi:single-strand DNA-binding protein
MQKNRIELAGYVAARCEAVRFLPSGTKVANLRLGESHRYKSDDQVVTQTNWHSLTFYDALADVALNFDKGTNLFIEGTLQQRKFTPKDGVERTVHEIIVRDCHVIAPVGAGKNGQTNAAAVTNGSSLTSERDLPDEDPSDLWPL